MSSPLDGSKMFQVCKNAQLNHGFCGVLNIRCNYLTFVKQGGTGTTNDNHISGRRSTWAAGTSSLSTSDGNVLENVREIQEETIVFAIKCRMFL